MTAADPTANAQQIDRAIRHAAAMRPPAIATPTAAATSLPPNNLTTTGPKPMTIRATATSPTGIKQMSAGFKADADPLKAEFGQSTNFPTAE